MGSPLLFERREYKYWVPESRTADIARFLAPHVRLDEFSAQAPERQYTITSLYLDTPRWHLYEDSLADRSERFKLRIRTYGPRSEGPITAECKRKLNGVILKSRAFVPRDRYPEVLLDPAEPGPPFASAEEEGYFRCFVRRMVLARARPRLLVRYTREAYESVCGDYARVTFDRRIAYQPADSFDLCGDPAAWIGVDGLRENGLGPLTALEIKCESVFPAWLFHLVRAFELQRFAFSKYVIAVQTEREQRWADREWALRPRFIGG